MSDVKMFSRNSNDSTDFSDSIYLTDIDDESDLLDPMCLLNMNYKVPVVISNLVKSHTRVMFIEESDIKNNYVVVDVDIDIRKTIYVPKQLMRYGFIVYYVGRDNMSTLPLTQDLVNKMSAITLIGKRSEIESKQKRLNKERNISRLSLCSY